MRYHHPNLAVSLMNTSIIASRELCRPVVIVVIMCCGGSIYVRVAPARWISATSTRIRRVVVKWVVVAGASAHRPHVICVGVVRIMGCVAVRAAAVGRGVELGLVVVIMHTHRRICIVVVRSRGEGGLVGVYVLVLDAHVVIAGERAVEVVVSESGYAQEGSTGEEKAT